MAVYDRTYFDSHSPIISTIDAINDNEEKAHSWAEVHEESTNAHTIATQQFNGFMSSEDKIKLDSATDSATANGIVRRNDQGRAKISTPVDNNDIANKQYVDSKVSAISVFLGKYTGNGNEVQKITLPFTPVAVEVMSKLETSTDATTHTTYCAMAYTGNPAMSHRGNYTSVEVVNGGFNVYYKGESSERSHFNELNKVFYFKAYKEGTVI